MNQSREEGMTRQLLRAGLRASRIAANETESALRGSESCAPGEVLRSQSRHEICKSFGRAVETRILDRRFGGHLGQSSELAG